MEILKVSTKSNPNSVAGALANLLKENDRVEVDTIGAGAINQAIKAVAIARGCVAPIGLELFCVPAFMDIVIDGQPRTAIKLIVEKKQP
ncbi:MAG: stage V sporulation protein S [Holdemania massiliensis]